MTKNELIKKLQKIEGNPEVLVDADADGYYTLEKVGTFGEWQGKNKQDKIYVNLRSSNES